ncbi:hypothetical protein [Arthrobacter koreensis]|uniref:hypothetical protein n=1 Tax=Arthrobacter koreensis TaxID=199136 RepID=UPI002DBDF695|nr:hypothetical protein [Arthrobacter koreensis]MEB7447279.1 hypothetical protein [Arthrobacter koreensis]
MALRNRKIPKVSIAWVILASFLAAVVSAYFAITLATAELANWGMWLRDFAQSPGAAGFAALIAAAIAFTGISSQVAVSKDALEHQRSAARADAWWAMFEWASERAIPPHKDDHPLPPSVTIRTLHRLSDDASTDVQKAACAGVIDVLTAQISETDVKQDNDEAAPVPQERNDSALIALGSYVESNRGTPGASTIAEEAVYANRVLKELMFLAWQDPKVRIEQNKSAFGDPGFDAIAEVDGRRVRIVIKATDKGSGGVRQIRNIRAHLWGPTENTPMLLITPSSTDLTPELAELGIVAARWRDHGDTGALRDSLYRASGITSGWGD